MMRFFSIFLISFLVACAPALPKESNNGSRIASPEWCQVDADCICGGIDTNTGDCYVGNKAYAEQYVDMSKQCPDFCNGITGNLETRCVQNKCVNVPREQSNESKPVACTADAKICPDGTAVGRVGPDCEFAPCPTPVDNGTGEADLSNAHWLCEDGSWAVQPEDCFENTCLSKSDCQLMGVSGICGPYMIAGPTATLHKPPVYYKDKCGAERCTVVTAMCVDPDSQPRVNGFDCVQGKCVVRYEEE